MKTQKNFYIVRYYLNDEVKVALTISKSQAKSFTKFFEDVHTNEAGGITTWFRVNLDPKENWFFNRENSTDKIHFA